MPTESRLRSRFLLIILAVGVVTLLAGAGVYWALIYGYFGGDPSLDWLEQSNRTLFAKVGYALVF